MPSLLHVDYLGVFKLWLQISQKSPAVTLDSPPTIKSQSLLAYLIFRNNQSQSRDHLVGMFWGEFQPEKARRSLSTALWHIRRCFPHQDPILRKSGSIQFAFDGDVNLDVADFEKKALEGKIADLEGAVELYKGEFLDGFFDNWIINERYRLQSLFIEALVKINGAA